MKTQFANTFIFRLNLSPLNHPHSETANEPNLGRGGDQLVGEGGYM
jgi:hypothetical protein